MEIEGIVVMELPLEEGVSQRTGNPWRKKGWIIETLGQYPRKAKVDVMGDRVDSFQLEVGKTYSISVDVESREYNGRWYTDLRAYSWRPLENQQPVQGGYQQPMGGPQFQQAPVSQPAQPAGPQFGGAAPTAPGTVLPTEDPTEDLPF